MIYKIGELQKVTIRNTVIRLSGAIAKLNHLAYKGKMLKHDLITVEAILEVELKRVTQLQEQIVG